MAQSSFPFENVDTTETQFSQMFRTLNAGVNGTPAGTELKVSAGTGLQVSVAAGQAMVRGHYYISTATELLTISTANATNPRIDTIVLRLDPVANSIVLAVVAGTAAASPVAPTLTQTDAGTYEFPLANVAVAAGAGTVGTITDRRVFMGKRLQSVGTSAARDIVFPAPVQGDMVWRDDLGATETYYGLYNASTNPGGRDTAGWYTPQKQDGLIPVKPSTITAVSGSASINSVGVVTFTNCTSLELYNLFSPAYRNYKIVLTVKRNGTSADSYLWARFGNTSSGFTSASYRGGLNSIEAGFTTMTNVGGGDGFYIGRWYYDGIFISGTAEIMAPNISTEVTHYTGQFQGYNSSSLLTTWSSGDQNTSTAWTDLKLNTSSPSMSGTIQILGYNDK